MIMRGHIQQSLNGVVIGEAEGVLEFGEDVARFDDFVEKVVVGGGVGEEVFPVGEGEGEDGDEEVDEFGGAAEGADVGRVGREEFEEREEGAPEFGPVVCCSD